MTWVYQYSVIRLCWCNKNRHKYKGDMTEFPLDIDKIKKKKSHLIEIQHFKNENDICKSNIRVICRHCYEYRKI